MQHYESAGTSVSARDGAPDQTRSVPVFCFFSHPVGNVHCYFRLNHDIRLWLKYASISGLSFWIKSLIHKPPAG